MDKKITIELSPTVEAMLEAYKAVRNATEMFHKALQIYNENEDEDEFNDVNNAYFRPIKMHILDIISGQIGVTLDCADLNETELYV